MADMMKTGVTWHAAKLKSHLSQTVVYRRGSLTVPISATFGDSGHDIVTPDGLIIEVHSRDFTFTVADLVLNGVLTTPERGDKVEFTDPDDGLRYTHELMSLSNEPAWRYADPYNKTYRIHTERIKLPT
jgi:hypothetical protein